MSDDVSNCSECGGPRRREPLTRPDGKQIGTLTLDVCDRCDDETEANLDAFLQRVRDGALPVSGVSGEQTDA